MAFSSSSTRLPAARSPAPVAALTFVWRGSPKTLRLNRVAAVVLAGILPLLAAWYLGATAYIVFHDPLLASLMSRQADMQYSYEDRIASLRTQLDRESSRGLVDRQTLSTTIRELVARSARLEAHAQTIDTLVRTLDSPDRQLVAVARSSARTPNPLLPSAFPTLPLDAQAYQAVAPTPPAPASTPDPASPSLRLDPSAEPEAIGGDHVDLSPEQQGRLLGARLAALEGRQAAHVARLRTPTMQAIARYERALDAAGVSLAHRKGDVGGPFVPLPDGVRLGSFDDDVALLRAAMVEHARLAGLADRVPLRHPLDGALEVTSPFGARLDPFYGRAAMHTGMDLMESYGGPARATAAGVVTVAGSEGGYGNMVEIDHGNGLVTRYAHLASIDVAVHEKVSPGTIVGRVGSTGRATGPHLHYETRINGEPVDPARFLKAGSGLFPG